MESKLDAYHAEDPDLAAGDIDAAWEDSIVAGEESVGALLPFGKGAITICDCPTNTPVRGSTI